MTHKTIVRLRPPGHFQDCPPVLLVFLSQNPTAGNQKKARVYPWAQKAQRREEERLIDDKIPVDLPADFVSPKDCALERGHQPSNGQKVLASHLPCATESFMQGSNSNSCLFVQHSFMTHTTPRPSYMWFPCQVTSQHGVGHESLGNALKSRHMSWLRFGRSGVVVMNGHKKSSGLTTFSWTKQDIMEKGYLVMTQWAHHIPFFVPLS